jgi:hypothetical protein
MSMFGDLLEVVGLSGLLSDGQWKTLKNGKRVKLDGDGRIVAGLPSKYHGVHVADFGRVSKEEREILQVDCEELASCHRCEKTFKTKDQAAHAVLAANPDFMDLQQSEFGRNDVAYLKWRRNGRRGPKPAQRAKLTDGRLDAINEFYELKGKNRVGSITEALYHTIPSSRRWADLEPRLDQLSELAGFPINLPEESLKLAAGAAGAEQCREEVDRRVAEIYKRARAGRVGVQEGEEAPF